MEKRDFGCVRRVLANLSSPDQEDPAWMWVGPGGPEGQNGKMTWGCRWEGAGTHRLLSWVSVAGILTPGQHPQHPCWNLAFLPQTKTHVQLVGYRGPWTWTEPCLRHPGLQMTHGGTPQLPQSGEPRPLIRFPSYAYMKRKACVLQGTVVQ